MFRSQAPLLAASLILFPLGIACDDDGDGGVDAGAVVDAGVDAGAAADAGVPALTFFTGATKGGPIAASPDGTLLAVANEATDDVTIFALPGMTEAARVAVGDEPTSVAWSPQSDAVYVVNRADASVTKISAANTASPTTTAVSIGSEPSRGALSAAGTLLYVPNWVDGTVSVIRTADLTVVDTVVTGGAPFAVCVSNDGDDDEDDETVWVTDFYSRPLAGVREATDLAREAQVFTFSAFGTRTPTATKISPTAEVFANTDFAGTGAYPNQLYSCAINEGYVYVTHVGASPAAFQNGTDFHQNIQGLVVAFNETTKAVAAARSLNYNNLVDAQTAPRRFVSVPVDIAFVPGTDIGYTASVLSNSVMRVDFGLTPPAVSSSANFLEAGLAPMGITISGSNAYVYNLVGRSVTVQDLAAQMVADPSGTASALQPAAGSSEADALLGQRFFFTGQARWSTGAWVGCVGCHPFGTTDNVTWVFPAGPRQTVDTNTTFSRDGTVRRILNWTAIFDEVHDFELNTRGVAGGVGAIVSAEALDTASRIDFVGAGGVGNPENGFNIGAVKALNEDDGVLEDWDRIDDYIKTIRSPRGNSTASAAAITAGRTVFEDGRCQNCHGGKLWTLAERYYTPKRDVDNRTVTLAAAGIADIGAVRPDQVSITDTMLTNVLEADTNGAPHRHVCTVRKVGTFDVDGPTDRGAAEIRQNGGAAQGLDGFNVPSLLNIGMGAPFLHNGAAETLEELLDPSGDFVTHLQAGNQIFAPSAADIQNLIAFLKSIDDTTAVIAVPTDQRFCPTGL